MGSGMAAEDYASFGWLFDAWSDMVISILTSSEPMLKAISQSSGSLVFVVGTAWLCLLFLNAAKVGLIRGALGGILIFAIITLGMQPATFSTPGRGAVEMVAIQQKPLNLVLSVHSIYAGSMRSALKDQTVAGSIIPAESATRDAVERSAQAFGDSDLSRLMRDYNAQCAPSKSMLAEPEHAQTRDALNAVGLLGGIVGIPEESITVLAQAKAGVGAIWSALSSPYQVWVGNAPAEINAAYDLGSIRSNRAAGLAALQKMNKSFHGGTYSLPSQSHWAGVYGGAAKSTQDYLRVSDLPSGLSADLEKNVGVWRASEGKAATIGLNPTTCVEAYQLAQFAAEKAYLALQEVGVNASGGQGIGAQSGAISATTAWQRTIGRSLNGGEAADGLANNAAGLVAGIQMVKSWWSWLDLQILLPAYVAGLAWLFCMVLLIAPIVLLIAPLRGIEVVLTWFSLLLFPLLALIFADILSVTASMVLAGASANHAAAASGWMGAGVDLDVVRGSMTMVAAVLLPASSWLAAQLTGVSVAGVAGSAGGAVVTASVAASAVGSAISMASSANQAIGKSTKKRKGQNPRGGGGGGGDGGGGGSSTSNRAPGSVVDPTPRTATSGTGGTSSGRASTRINLNPAGAAANADNFGGRTPRSIRNKRPEPEKKD